VGGGIVSEMTPPESDRDGGHASTGFGETERFIAAEVADALDAERGAHHKPRTTERNFNP